jgi:hypothetical protein
LFFLAALLLIGASTGVTFTHEYLFNTGETWYSSTEITDSGVRNVEFYNDGETEFSKTESVDSDQLDEHMSGDFEGYTVFTDFSVINDTGGEKSLSISNASMSVEKDVSMTSNSYSASEEVSLSSVGGNSFRSELMWWIDSKMQKDRTTTVPAVGLEQIQSTYSQGTGDYSTIFLTSYPININSYTYIWKD